MSETSEGRVSDAPVQEEYQYRDPRRVIFYVCRIGDRLLRLTLDDPVEALIRAEDLLANALSVVRLCLGTLMVGDDGGQPNDP